MDCTATSVRDKPQRKMHSPCSAWANCIKYSLFMEIDCLVRFTSVFVVIFLHAIHLTTIDEPWQWAVIQVWHRLQPQDGAGEKEEQKSEEKQRKNVVNVRSPTPCRHAQCRRKGEQRRENKQNIARNNWNCVLKKAIISIYSSAAVVSFAHSLSLPIASFTWCSHRCLAEY